MTGQLPLDPSEDYLEADEAMWDEVPWSVGAMDQLYIVTYEAMFHEKPPADENGLRPKESWRCSSLGRCMRFQILERSGMEKPVIDEASRRRMDIGSQLHWLYGLKRARFGLLLARESAITDPELALSGHIDILWGGPIQDIPENWRVYRKPDWIFFLEELRRRARASFGDSAPVTMDELKTVASYGFRDLDRLGRFDYRMQLAGYRLLAERHPDLLPSIPERYQIVVFNRESGAVRPIRMADSWLAEAEERLGLLNQAWASGNWPTCTCGDTEGLAWEAKLCPWTNPAGDGCCGQTLLDRLEASVEVTRR